MHPECRYQERLEYWRSRTARKRGQLELLRPALMPLLSVLASETRRRQWVGFGAWAAEVSRAALAGNISTDERVRLQRYLAFAQLISSIAREAPPASELRQAGAAPTGPGAR